MQTPNRSAKNSLALKTLDKYAVAVKSILERNEEDGERHVNHIDWKGKINLMVIPKYEAPKPAEYHDDTVRYLNDVRNKRKADGVNVQSKQLDRVINDPTMKDYDRLTMVRSHAQKLEQKAKRDELVLMYAGDMGVDKEMEVNDMYLDAISAKLKILDRI